MRIRGFIFWTHLLAGVAAGLVILALSLTGVCLAFEPRIIVWAEGNLRTVARPADARPRLGLDELLAKAREKNPGLEPSAATLNSDPSTSILVNLGREDVVYLNPYTGEPLGHGSRARAWLQQIEGWHRWLGVQSDHRAAGRAITGAANLIFLVLAVSGLYLWWPRNWNWRALRPSVWFVGGLRGKARDWNWHNAAGFWCAPALIILTLTGVIMSYQWANNLLYTLTGNQPPPANQIDQARRGEGRQREARSAGGMRPSLETLFRAVERQAPDWKTFTLRLPQRPDAPIVASIQQPGSGLSFARSQLTFDPRTGEVVKWEPSSGLNLGRKLRLWARFLHTGEAGGLPGQTIAALASAGACVLVVTGLSVTVRRFLWRQSIGIQS